MPEIDRERWQVLSAHLDRALEMSVAEREALLTTLAAADASLAAQLRALLAHREPIEATGFLSGNAVPEHERQFAASMIGRAVGPYVIESEIARGGMGSVWRARRADGHYAGFVAIKFLNASVLGSEGEQRFRSEGNLLARLSHPNIARLLDAGMLDGTQPYLVLEYVEGEPIDAYCRQAQLDVRARIRLLLSVCRAVSHAHSHLIVHRDLKPSNVLVTHDGVVKLLDFGIAKLLSEDGSAVPLTRSGVHLMTPEFAAPEQLLGQPITTATDVYALGLLSYLILVGKHPVAIGPGTQWMRDIVERDPARASVAAAGNTVLARALQGDLDTIIAKALKKDPAERYAGVGALADDFGRYLDHQAVLAAPDTMTYRVSKFVRRHRGGVLVASLMALALIAATVVTTLQLLETRRQRDLAQVALQRAEGFNDLSSIVLSTSGGDSGTITTAQLLDRAEQLVRTEFAADPALRAHLYFALARIHAQSGQTGKQGSLYALALESARSAADPRMTALASCAVAATDAVTGKVAGTERRIAAVIDALPADESYNDALADCWRFRSTAASFAGDAKAALAAALRAEAISGGGASRTEWSRVSANIMVADAQRKAGEYAQADSTYQAASSALRRLGLENTSFNSTLLNNWALNLTALGQPRRAAMLLEQVIRLDRASGAVDAFVSTNYASVLVQLERPAEAQTVLEAALVSALKDNNRNAANMVRNGLGVVYRETGDFDRADQFIAEAAQAIAEMLPPGHEAFGAIDLSRANLAYRRRQLPLALREVDAALAIFDARPALANRAANARVLKSRILLDLSLPAEALAQADQARLAFARIVGPSAQSAHLGLAWLAVARARLANRDAAGARQAAALAHGHLLATLGAEHSATREASQLGGSDP